MGSSVRLGRIAGIEFGVNWSWLVVFALLVWTLASGIFPSTNPGLSKGTYIAAAIVAAFLFFVSLLLHEFGHALQARREGIEIDGITLWLFGGVARFKGSFPSAGAEFRVAVAGPLVSLALGVLFVLIALINGIPSVVDGAVSWLGYINLSLLAFNLIPAPPLDGGRILHAALWRWRGDFAWATRVAANVGRGFGYLLIAAGIAMFIFQGSFSGAWLAFLGWFLLNAATAEARYLLTQQALRGLRVGDVMTSNPVVVSPDTTLGEFMDRVAFSQRHTTYPVVENGKVVGLLPFRCVANVPRGEWDTRRVRDCLVPLDKVPVLREDEAAVDALAELSQSSGGHGLVVSNGGLAGIVSTSDLARALDARPRRGTSTPSSASL
ncbi:MAG TPA: site-2 protease family protein [Gaiellaceae bacterium]|nr:site-2 protease family protein [Gaiellaceae bacterium]